VDYYSRKGYTTVIICYKSWWKRRRKLKFVRRRVNDKGPELHQQSPEAQALIAKLKKILNPTAKRALFENESSKAALKSLLPVFRDTPRFMGWRTEK
jgi:hypothetical protein